MKMPPTTTAVAEARCRLEILNKQRERLNGAELREHAKLVRHAETDLDRLASSMTAQPQRGGMTR